MMIAAVTGPTPKTDQVSLRAAWSPENWRGWVICKTPHERVGFTLSRASLSGTSLPLASRLPLQISPLVTDLAAEGIPVAVTCRVLKVSKQGYYRWRASPVTKRDSVDAHPVNAALDSMEKIRRSGTRFIADELPEKGFGAGDNRVQRLCRDHGIWSVFSKRRGLNR
jgi:hypothetical protein